MSSLEELVRRSLVQQIKEASHQKNPFVMILMPGVLHMVDLTLGYLPGDLNLILILNGFSSWERKWAEERLKPKLKHELRE